MWSVGHRKPWRDGKDWGVKVHGSSISNGGNRLSGCFPDESTGGDTRCDGWRFSVGLSSYQDSQVQYFVKSNADMSKIHTVMSVMLEVLLNKSPCYFWYRFTWTCNCKCLICRLNNWFRLGNYVLLKARLFLWKRWVRTVRCRKSGEMFNINTRTSCSSGHNDA